MPIYEFRCLECSQVFELLVMGTEDGAEVACPHCDSRQFERLMSAAGHQVRSGGAGGPSVQHRACSGGTCSTVTLPGPD